MRTARQHPRTNDTHDLLAHVRPTGRPLQVGRVLNLSEGGMLIADGELNVGDTTNFELEGPGFHYAGVAEVAHLTTEGTGLRFLSWQGQDRRLVRSMIERSDWGVPKAARGPDRPMIRRVAVLVGPQRPSGHASTPRG
jgi:hypothetical protein